MEGNTGDAAELRKEFHNRKKEVSVLRSQLHALHAQKEEIFLQLRSLSDSIRSALSQVTVLKQERDQLTAKVKGLKLERDKFHAVVQEKSAQKKIAAEEKKELLEKVPHSTSPAALKSLIARLEEKLETEVMPFPKEEQIRKKIKELQASYKQFEQLGEISKGMNTAAAGFAEARRKAEQLHQEVQETAILSQKKHEQINELYAQIKAWKEKEKPLRQKFLELKAQLAQVKKSLEEALSRFKELSAIFSQEETKSFKEQVREKTAQVAEKIKKKEKLNIDDILAFQASEK